ncbi:hypothetical protein [Propionivibrio sp.]|uniref:hypothetical protein n=1 Tax=Propionivibrio sp. TaxID=2212460 RepID=UPI003BF1F15E
MGIIELSNALGLSKSTVSHLVKKGMPVNSTDSAQAWRETNAKPRAKRGQAGSTPPVPVSPAASTELLPSPPPRSRDTDGEDPEESNNDPRQSLRRARRAELVGYNELLKCQKSGGSVEDFRKANSVYISSRNNRIRAEKDFKEHQRQESILLYFDEARDVTSRPHLAAKNMLDGLPKTLAPRLVGQPQKAIEKTLAEWADSVLSAIRKGI